MKADPAHNWFWNQGYHEGLGGWRMRYAQAAGAPRLAQLEAAYADALSALCYIRLHHGELYGVGWERLDATAEALRARHARGDHPADC